MRDRSTTVDHWLELAHPDLTEHVRRAVRGGSTATAPWPEVAAHPVLAARVRGILSALQSQMADHRDHAMWTVWINSARRALTVAPTPPPAPVETRQKAPVTPVQEAPAISIATAPPPRTRHVVAPMTFQAPSQIPATNNHE